MRWILFFLVFVLLSFLVSAEDVVVVNSRDWQDVSSGLLYGKFAQKPVSFITSESQGLDLYQNVLDRNVNNILLVNSKDNSFLPSYENNLKSVGFNVEVLESYDRYQTNLELAKRLGDKIKGYIVIDDAFSYNLVSVVPYAVKNSYYILFASRDNVGEVYDFLVQNSDYTLLYGSLDRGVKRELMNLNPEVIDTGDKHKDNLVLVDNFLSQVQVEQAIFLNGDIVEPTIFEGSYPVIFLGTTNIPQQVVDYLIDSGIQVGVFIGSDLIQNALKLKEMTGLMVIMKFGQGIGGQMYDLDIFDLKGVKPKVSISDIKYNLVSKQLEVIYENQGNSFAFVQALALSIYSNDNFLNTLSDKEPFFMAAGEKKTVVYDFETQESSLNLKSLVVYGSSLGSLEWSSEQELNIEIINFKDDSEVIVESVVYDRSVKSFLVKVKNTGSVGAYVDLEILDFLIDKRAKILAGDMVFIDKGKSKEFKIRQDLESSDFLDNSKVMILLRFGVREDALVKFVKQEYELDVRFMDYKLVVLFVIGLIIVILIRKIVKKRKL